MVKHVYLIKLKEREWAAEVVEKIRTLQDNVPSILRVEAAADFRGVKGSYDLIEICEFRTMADFEAFCVDPYHEQIRQYMAQVVEHSCKVDYILEE